MNPAQDIRSTSGARVIVLKKLWIAAISVFVVLFAIGVFAPQHPVDHVSRSQQIQDGCQREFDREGAERIRECATEIMLREMAQRETEKMERAAR